MIANFCHRGTETQPLGGSDIGYRAHTKYQTRSATAIGGFDKKEDPTVLSFRLRSSTYK